VLWQNRRDLKKRAEQLEEIVRCRPKTRLIKSKAAPAINSVTEEGGGGRTLFATGSRGLGASKRVLLGSVSTAVLRRADGPVLVVPPSAAQVRPTKRPPEGGVARVSRDGTGAFRYWMPGPGLMPVREGGSRRRPKPLRKGRRDRESDRSMRRRV
jgi:hypothetical protein